MNTYNLTQKRYSKNNYDIVSARKYKHFSYVYDLLKLYLPERGSLLDAGCGMGIWTDVLVREHDLNPYGFDLSADSLKIARKLGIKTKIASIESRWPYKSGQFDIVTSMQTIEHIVNTDNLIKESYRVLKTDGILVVSTPNLASWFNRILLLVGVQPFTTEVSTYDKTIGLSFTRHFTKNRKPMGHIRSFTKGALKDIALYHSFHEVVIIGSRVDYVPKPFYLADQFFSNFPSLSSDIILIAKK